MEKPTSANTKAEIQAYLDAQGIQYSSTATKDELLALVEQGTTDTPTEDASGVTNEPVTPTEVQPDTQDQSTGTDGGTDTPSPDPEPTPQPEPTPTPEPVEPVRQTYTVQLGDILAIVATRFGLSVGHLRAMNPGLKFKIYPGQVLFIEEEH